MTKRLVEVEYCYECPHIHFALSKKPRCRKTGNVIETDDEIPDDCPLPKVVF